MSEPICKECMHREYCNRSDINFQPKPEVVPPVLQCDSFKTAKITNADRIRNMTDEQIEDWYWWMHQEMMSYTDSVEFLHQWLKEEVKE